MSLYRYERRSSPALLLFGIACVAALMLALGAYQVTRALPNPTTSITLPQSSVLGQPRMPDLPQVGQSIVAVEGLGVLGRFGDSEAKPIASVTKMMTAYVLLQEYQLQPGDAGPAIEVTQADADRFWDMVAEDQSVQPVNAGQFLTLYQLLQGMLIPSANNYAEIAAVWDAGSVEAFVSKMNQTAAALGMNNTIYDDVSGFSDLSVSTAADQLILAREAMKNPVFAEIVATKQVELPGAGLVSNVNELLGVAGVNGIKTGQTEAAGGNLAFAATRESGGRTIEITGAIFNQETRDAAFDATIAAINSLNNGLQVLRVVPRGQVVGTVEPAWGDAVNVVTAHEVSMLVWSGMTLETVVEYGEISPDTGAGEQVGELIVRLGEQEDRIPLVLDADLPGASLSYKLTRF